MVKISQQKIDDIISDIRNNLDKDEVMSKHAISCSTYYRYKKSIENDKIEQESFVSDKTIKIEDMNNNKDVINIVDENEDIFKSNTEENVNENFEETSDKNSYSNHSEKPQPNIQNFKPNIDIIDSNNIITYPLPQEQTILVHDTYKERKHLTIIIRNYIELFHDKLYSIVGSTENQKLEFIRKLNNFSLDDLNMIKQNIIYELSVKNNYKKFLSLLDQGLSIYETVLVSLNVDISGFADDIRKNEDAQIALKMMSCEINLTDYIDPKKTILYYIVTGSIKKFQENKNKKMIEQKINNNNNVIDYKNILNKYSSIINN